MARKWSILPHEGRTKKKKKKKNVEQQLAKIYTPNNKFFSREWSLPKSKTTVYKQSDRTVSECGDLHVTTSTYRSYVGRSISKLVISRSSCKTSLQYAQYQNVRSRGYSTWRLREP